MLKYKQLQNLCTKYNFLQIPSSQVQCNVQCPKIICLNDFIFLPEALNSCEEFFDGYTSKQLKEIIIQWYNNI